MSCTFACRVLQASWPLSIRQSSCTPSEGSDEQDIVNQITDFILLHHSSFVIREFGVGNEIGSHQLLCEAPDDLIVAARQVYTGWERYQQGVSRWIEHLTFAGVNQHNIHTTYNSHRIIDCVPLCRARLCWCCYHWANSTKWLKCYTGVSWLWFLAWY